MSNFESGNFHSCVEEVQDLRSYLKKKRAERQRSQTSIHFDDEHDGYTNDNHHLISYDYVTENFDNATQDASNSYFGGYDDIEAFTNTSVGFHQVDTNAVYFPVGYHDDEDRDKFYEDFVKSSLDFGDGQDDSIRCRNSKEDDTKSSFEHHDCNENIRSGHHHKRKEYDEKFSVDDHKQNGDSKRHRESYDSRNGEGIKARLGERENNSREKAIDFSMKEASEKELRDIQNPKWRDVVKWFENDKHELLRYRWNATTLANPKRNLTVLSYASTMFDHRLPSPITMDSISVVDDVDPSDEQEKEGPPAKKPRKQNCTIVIERVLDDLNKRLGVLKTALAGKKAMALSGATPREPMKMERRTQKYKNMAKERQAQKTFEDCNLTRALDSMAAQIHRLDRTRNEMLHFHRFYDESFPEQDSSLLDEDELDDLLSTEAVLSTYRDVYGG